MKALRRIAIAVVVLFLLFVAADRVGVHLVEGKAADRLNGRFMLTSKPDVSINGFPFLTQVTSGRFDDIRIEAPKGQVTTDGEKIVLRSLKLTLHGAEPRNGYHHITVDQADGSAVISYSAANRLLGNPDLHITGYAGDGRVRFTGSMPYHGKSAEGKGTAELGVKEDGRTVVPKKISVQGLKLGGVSVPKALTPLITNAVEGRMTVARSFDGLPGGLKLKSIRPAADGVHINLTGRGVRV